MADTIPMKLVAYSVVTAVVIGFVAISMRGALLGLEDAAVERELLELRASLSSLDGHARDLNDPLSPLGASVVVEMDLPDDLLWLRIEDHEATYLVEGRGPRVIPLPVEIRTSTGSPLILYSGRYVLTAELIRDHNGYYALLGRYT